MPSGSVPTVLLCHGWSDDVHCAETVTTGPKDQAVTSPHWPDATVTRSVRDTKSYGAMMRTTLILIEALMVLLILQVR